MATYVASLCLILLPQQIGVWTRRRIRRTAIKLRSFLTSHTEVVGPRASFAHFRLQQLLRGQKFPRQCRPFTRPLSPLADAAVALSALSVRSAHPVCHSLDEARSEKPILLRGIFLRVWDRFRARRSLTRLVSHLQNSFSSLLGNSHHMS